MIGAVDIKVRPTGEWARFLSKVKLEKSIEVEEKLKKMQIARNFCEKLEENGISYQWCIKHPEVLGCMESRTYYERYQEYLGDEYSICKHILVHERKGEKRNFLIIVDDTKKVDLKELKEELGTSKLEFVSSEEMEELLHTVPGNVSVFHTRYDKDEKVHVVIDQELLDKKLLAFHPLYNGMSLFLAPDATIQYLNTIHHSFDIRMVPAKESEKVLEKSL